MQKVKDSKSIPNKKALGGANVADMSEDFSKSKYKNEEFLHTLIFLTVITGGVALVIYGLYRLFDYLRHLLFDRSDRVATVTDLDNNQAELGKRGSKYKLEELTIDPQNKHQLQPKVHAQKEIPDRNLKENQNTFHNPEKNISKAVKESQRREDGKNIVPDNINIDVKELQQQPQVGMLNQNSHQNSDPNSNNSIGAQDQNYNPDPKNVEEILPQIEISYSSGQLNQNVANNSNYNININEQKDQEKITQNGKKYSTIVAGNGYVMTNSK